MQKEDVLIEKIGRDPGFRVPDGYFQHLPEQVAAKLPPYPEVKKEKRLSAWQKVRPYIYMAAMFAGIWLMMKVFHDVSSSQQLNLDNPPAAIAQAMIDYDEPSLQTMDATFDAISDVEMVDEMSLEYSSISEFEGDFGYELQPEYASINVPDLKTIAG